MVAMAYCAEDGARLQLLTSSPDRNVVSRSREGAGQVGGHLEAALETLWQNATFTADRGRMLAIVDATRSTRAKKDPGHLTSRLQAPLARPTQAFGRHRPRELQGTAVSCI